MQAILLENYGIEHLKIAEVPMPVMGRKPSFGQNHSRFTSIPQEAFRKLKSGKGYR